jgi:hypothetical protein
MAIVVPIRKTRGLPGQFEVRAGPSPLVLRICKQSNAACVFEPSRLRRDEGYALIFKLENATSTLRWDSICAPAGLSSFPNVLARFAGALL